MSATAQAHQQDLERLKLLRYMDDDFMTVCLADNFEGVELILQIVLGKRNIKIKSVRTQEPLKNLQGRSATLDVHAVDSDNKEFDVEIQRKDAGAGAKRARHNSSLLDAHILKAGDDTEDIKVLFGDGSHILYVNEKYRGNDEIGKLMHDFSCTNPYDMNYEVLAKKARYFKQDEKGVATMCKIMEDMRNEAARDKLKEKAILMLKNGKISLDEIQIFFSELSNEEIEEVKAEVMQLA